MPKNQKGFAVIEVLLVLVIVGLIGGLGWYVYQQKDAGNEAHTPQITSYDTCVAAGNPATLSEPPQCTADGQTFTRAGNTSTSIVDLGELRITLTSENDLEKLPDDVPSSFVTYLKGEFRKAAAEDSETACKMSYSVKRYSNVNIDGSSGPATDTEGCGSGAHTIWYLQDDQWHQVGLQGAWSCAEVAKTTIYREFLETCVDSDSAQSMVSNPNGSIDAR